MRAGVSLTSAHATGDSRLAARFMVERAAAARRAGLVLGSMARLGAVRSALGR